MGTSERVEAVQVGEVLLPHYPFQAIFNAEILARFERKVAGVVSLRQMMRAVQGMVSPAEHAAVLQAACSRATRELAPVAPGPHVTVVATFPGWK